MITKTIQRYFILTIVVAWLCLDASQMASAEILIAPDGKNGTPGQPNGGTGEDGWLADLYSVSDANVVTAVGGKGGKGGKGQNGANPGLGGNGGKGGDASATQQSTVPMFEVTSQGGSGGDGGGQGVSTVLANGGNGGNGGAATSFAGFINSDAIDAVLSSIGGNGGAAGVGIGNGGKGGNASSSTSAIGFADTSVEMIVSGGMGGNSNIGNGGNGGDAVSSSRALSNPNIANTISLSTMSNVVGGNGGLSELGSGGVGGKATAYSQAYNTMGDAMAFATARSGTAGASGIANANLVQPNTEAKVYAESFTSNATATANAYGGHAGAKTITGTPTQGMTGGNATALGLVAGAQNASITLNSYGGQGGSVVDGTGGKGGDGFIGEVRIGRSLNLAIAMSSYGGKGGDVVNGTGGAGGAAQSGTVTTTNFSTTNLKASIVGQVHGGDGGNATGTGKGGSGASVNLVNTLGFRHANESKAYQSAFGGNAGSSSSLNAGAGTAGSASSKLAIVGSGINNVLEVGASAVGGRGATAVGRFIGKGGDATSDASANSGGSSVAALANSLGGSGNVGGKASATAIADIVGNGSAHASAIARGGDNGSAMQTSQSANSNAYSISHGGGASSSYANASHSRNSSAAAESRGGTAYSRAYSSGDLGNARANSISEITAGPRAIAFMQSYYSNNSAHVATFSSIQNSLVPDMQDVQSYCYVLASQSDTVVNSFIQGQTEIAQSIVDIPSTLNVEYEALALGEFSMGFGQEGGVSAQDGNFNVVLSTYGSYLGEELYLGLFDGDLHGFTKAGASWSLTVRNGIDGLVKNWNSTNTDFEDLFSDNAISIGLNADPSRPYVSVSMSWKMTDIADALSGKFIVTTGASPVPEPSTFAVIGLIASAGVGRAIRKRVKKRELV